MAPSRPGPKGNRIYFAYGTNEGGVLQIVDREKLLNGPKEPTDENLLYPQVGRLDMSPLTGAHTTFPVLEMPVAEFAKDKVGKVRNFVVVTNEQIKNECEEPRQFVWMVDVTVERYPASVSTWGVPEASGGFCSRGGRFGTHASNESMTPIYYKRLMFFSHFNAGVRAVDIRDPYRMKEVAYYIPADHQEHRQALHQAGERRGALQGGDPDQQRRGRRPRLHLRRRPRQYRDAHPGADRRRAADREFRRTFPAEAMAGEAGGGYAASDHDTPRS